MRQKESEISIIEIELVKEKKDKRTAQKRGAAVGGTAGAVIGVGSKGGRLIEEIGMLFC
jgi:hypothetical protein